MSESVLHPVSDTSDRSDEIPSLAQLVSKPPDVGVHGVCRPLIGLTPHGAQKGSSSKSRPCIFQKAGQQLELCDGQIDFLFSDEDLIGVRVERNTRALENTCLVNHVRSIQHPLPLARISLPA